MILVSTDPKVGLSKITFPKSPIRNVGDQKLGQQTRETRFGMLDFGHKMRAPRMIKWGLERRVDDLGQHCSQGGLDRFEHKLPNSHRASNARKRQPFNLSYSFHQNSKPHREAPLRENMDCRLFSNGKTSRISSIRSGPYLNGKKDQIHEKAQEKTPKDLIQDVTQPTFFLL